MIRLIRFLVWAGIAVAVVVFFANQPGRIRIDWLDWRIDTSMAVAVVAAAVLVGVLVVLWRTLSGVLNLPERISRWRQRRRERRGLRDLTRGLTALAVGKPGEAVRRVERIESLPETAGLAQLLRAQAFLAEGRLADADAAFTAMLAEPETAFLGRRGLLKLALQQGDLAGALIQAEAARVLAPTTPWLLRILFDLHCRRGAWADAATTLGALGRAKVLEGAELAQRQATVTLALARQAEAEAAPDTALRHAKAAVQAAPSFVPAVTALARLETSHGKPARALAAIEKLWPTTQHPDLAATYLAAAPGDALDRFRRAEKLAALAPEAAESHLLLGVAALDAKLWGEAKRHFEDALHADPTHPRRALKGLARAEADGFDRREIAHQHRDRASDAADDARWHCTACGMVQPAWSPSCTACGAVDTVTWSTPGTTSRSTALVQLVPDAGDGARLALTWG